MRKSKSNSEITVQSGAGWPDSSRFSDLSFSSSSVSLCLCGEQTKHLTTEPIGAQCVPSVLSVSSVFSDLSLSSSSVSLCLCGEQTANGQQQHVLLQRRLELQ